MSLFAVCSEPPRRLGLQTARRGAVAKGRVLLAVCPGVDRTLGPAETSATRAKMIEQPRAIPRKGVRGNRATERAGVRAVTAVFEDANMLVQPIDGSVDIGKDLYVDITENDEVTGELIAVQVKAGESYRAGDHYAIPCARGDCELWRSSTVPIFGIVHDASRGSYWTNLSAWARSNAAAHAGAAPVSNRRRFESRTLAAFVAEAREYLRASGPPSLIALADDDPVIQRSAVYDAFALGRHDARALLLLRSSLRYLTDPTPLRFAIHVLALCIGHGDTFYTPRNWIDPAVASRARCEFTWSYDELCQLLSAADAEEYERGGLGQDVAVLVGAGWAPDVTWQLEDVVKRADISAAWPALMMLVTSAAEDGLELFDHLVPRSPALRTDPAAQELRHVLAEHGSVTMW